MKILKVINKKIALPYNKNMRKIYQKIIYQKIMFTIFNNNNINNNSTNKLSQILLKIIIAI